MLDHNPAAAALFAKMPQMEQEPTHVLWFQKGRDPYNSLVMDQVCAQALFQKTEYKSDLAQNPPSGSMADWLEAPFK